MEIKIPKEVRLHKETVLFGLTLRQLLCSGLAVGTAAFPLKSMDVVDKCGEHEKKAEICLKSRQVPALNSCKS